MADIIRHPGAGSVSPATDDIENRFAIAFAPAQPVFNAMTKLRKVRNFIDERDRCDPNRNQLFGYLLEQLSIIPDIATLQQAKHLFQDAEHVPAPEEYYFLAIGVMLAAAPNSTKVAVDYSYGLVDSIMCDEELHRGYPEMGYSFAVVAQAIREVRRTCKYVPSAQELLEACDRQRRTFRKLIVDVDLMISVREEAEAPPPPPVTTPEEDNSDVPF